MNYEGVNFVEDSCKGKTEAEFIAHESHHGLSVAQLKEAYALMNPVKEKISLKKDQPVDTGSASKKAE